MCVYKKILEKDGKQKREVLNICQCMVDCLFEHLLTLQDSNSKVFFIILNHDLFPLRSLLKNYMEFFLRLKL
jgi:hypothetical protein